MRELDGGNADAARAAVHEEPLSALQAAALEHVVPHGEEALGDRGRFRHRQAGWHRQAGSLICGAIFRVAAAGDERHHAVALFEAACAGTQRRDRARNLEPGNLGVSLGRGIVALALHEIGAVDARRRHLDEHLPRAGSGDGECNRPQNLRTAALIRDRYGGHAGR